MLRFPHLGSGGIWLHVLGSLRGLNDKTQEKTRTVPESYSVVRKRHPSPESSSLPCPCTSWVARREQKWLLRKNYGSFWGVSVL